MQQLIQITTDPKNGNVVSARELYEFLEVQTDFSDWCKRMFEYGFEENKDYSLLKIGERKAHNKTDYALTIDTAKEISMLQRSEKGKQIRNYFIEAEKQLRLQGHKQHLLPPMSMTLQLAEWSSKKPEIDYRTPFLSLHRFYRKPEPEEESDCLSINELYDFTKAFGGAKVQMKVLKKELANMGLKDEWVTVNGKQKLGYKVIILPFSQK